MSAESLLIILLVGGIAGWLAGLIVHGTGFGLVADIALGIVGAFVGNWLRPKLGLRLGGGLVAEIIIATIGALVLLIVLGLFQRSGGERLSLTPPGFPIFVISLALAIIALLIFYAGGQDPGLQYVQGFRHSRAGLCGAACRRVVSRNLTELRRVNEIQPDLRAFARRSSGNSLLS
jgi:uncharacterized membrane protein YeaQ/YmgE (transglycosylase-associated protein family)